MIKILCLFDQQCAIDRVSSGLSEIYEVTIARSEQSLQTLLDTEVFDVFICSAFLNFASIESLLLRMRRNGRLLPPTIAVRDQLSPVAIQCDRLLEQTTLVAGASVYMSLERLLRHHEKVIASLLETPTSNIENLINERVRKAR